MRTPSTKTLKYWLNTYTKVHDIPELAASFARSGEIAKIGGWEEDPREIADLLMKHPFTGFFYGFLDDSESSYKISVIHHAFKLEPAGIDFEIASHMVYGIEGLGKHTIITEISTDIFEPSEDRSKGFFTPSISDFIAAAGDAEKTKDLSAVTGITTSKEALGSGLVINSIQVK